jgi:transposase InsO family protein
VSLGALRGLLRGEPFAAHLPAPPVGGRWQGSIRPLQRELLDQVEVWPDLQAAQAAIDAFRREYNTNRPHQSLNMAFPADRFTPRTTDDATPLRLPATPPAPGCC